MLPLPQTPISKPLSTNPLTDTNQPKQYQYNPHLSNPSASTQDLSQEISNRQYPYASSASINTTHTTIRHISTAALLIMIIIGC